MGLKSAREKFDDYLEDMVDVYSRAMLIRVFNILEAYAKEEDVVAQDINNKYKVMNHYTCISPAALDHILEPIINWDKHGNLPEYVKETLRRAGKL